MECSVVTGTVERVGSPLKAFEAVTVNYLPFINSFCACCPHVHSLIKVACQLGLTSDMHPATAVRAVGRLVAGLAETSVRSSPLCVSGWRWMQATGAACDMRAAARAASTISMLAHRAAPLPRLLDPLDETYAASTQRMAGLMDDMNTVLSTVRAGGGDKANARHATRGKLPPRARIDALLDDGSPFLELSPLAGHGLYGTYTGGCLVRLLPGCTQQPTSPINHACLQATRMCLLGELSQAWASCMAGSLPSLQTMPPPRVGLTIP